MFTVYILYSVAYGKTYVGFTGNIDRRMLEHNEAAASGYSIKYRPWIIIHTESFNTKAEAMAREKYYKTGVGRERIKAIVQHYLQSQT